MPKLLFHEQNIVDMEGFLALCPFQALELSNGKVQANAACKMCRICVKKGPVGAAEWVEDAPIQMVDKASWHGIMVYVDHVDGKIHPVTFELLGKAKSLAQATGEPVFALMIGDQIKDKAKELLHYGVDEVLLYEHETFKFFRIDSYTNVFENAIDLKKPASILVGATTVGRQLTPRVAARKRTGLTADCTVLEMRETGDLVQIRPAFGGNIMAQIVTPNHRPQMATVRYKVMSAPERNDDSRGKITLITVTNALVKSSVSVLEVRPKPQEESIEAAETLVVIGRGVKKQQDLEMIQQFAQRLGAQLACTRPIVEAGWMDACRQIGLSGRTVRPRLIVTLGVSGTIQFVAGMNQAETIIAINKDEDAPIFKTAHYAIVGDLYQILPKVTEMLNKREAVV